jgi:predicted small lipoprotein YifL
MKPLSAALFTLLVLTGCGQKGPLYLPEDTSGAAPTAAQEEPIQQPTEK